MSIFYPRVLIIGETFRLNAGGGITLSNLFREWPAENIAVITDKIGETNPLTKYKYYQIGSSEIKFPFPFNFMQTYAQSGPYIFSSDKPKKSNISNSNKSLRLRAKIHPYFDKFLNRIGLASLFYRINLSEVLRTWILDFKPDIVYVQPFHHRTMQFGNLLFKELNIPYAVHIMDDSIKFINKSIFFWKLIQNQIENDFKKLITNAKVHMTISQAMSDEYLLRYGKCFTPFRNPINVDKWIFFQKKNMITNPERLKIVYTGRLFSPTLSSLIDLCKVVDGLNRQNKIVDLHIYTYDRNPLFIDIIQKMTGINIYAPVDNLEMPKIINQYDIFFICLDFENEAQKYSQFSISTRTSEGMISGVPVLVYAPSNSALYKYFLNTDSGCSVGERNLKQLESSVLKLWEDGEFRKRISSNAVHTALSDSDSISICEKFRMILAEFRNE